MTTVVYTVYENDLAHVSHGVAGPYFCSQLCGGHRISDIDNGNRLINHQPLHLAGLIGTPVFCYSIQQDPQGSSPLFFTVNGKGHALIYSSEFIP